MTAARTSSLVAARSDVEAEFERFAADLVAVKWRNRSNDRPPGASPRGPLPSISAEHIYEAALELVDREGVEALTARRLAAELRISTRTLYKRIKNRPNLIRNVGDLFAARLDIELRWHASWETIALDWCIDLHRKVTSHPHLAELLADTLGSQLLEVTEGFAEGVVGAGISRDAAIDMCRKLANTTLNNARAAARLRRAGAAGGVVHLEAGRDAERDLIETISLVIDGVRSRAAVDGSAARTGGV